MKIYLISQDVNDYYDTYDSAVVIAANEEQARNTYPGDEDGRDIDFNNCWDSGNWVKSPNDVTVEYIGETDIQERRVICSSFNAG